MRTTLTPKFKTTSEIVFFFVSYLALKIDDLEAAHVDIPWSTTCRAHTTPCHTIKDVGVVDAYIEIDTRADDKDEICNPILDRKKRNVDQSTSMKEKNSDQGIGKKIFKLVIPCRKL